MDEHVWRNHLWHTWRHSGSAPLGRNHAKAEPILNLKDKALFLPTGNVRIKKAIDFVTRQPVRMQKCEGGVLLTLNQAPTDVDKVLELELVQR